MKRNLEISFNSPQCGWMSVGFLNDAGEFHTTTAHAPHHTALPDLLRILTWLLDGGGDGEQTLKWNRDPEEFDLKFIRLGDEAALEIYEYPTDARSRSSRELVFRHTGPVKELCTAFGQTFERLYADRDTDEFEFNWRQPFPVSEFEMFRSRLNEQR